MPGRRPEPSGLGQQLVVLTGRRSRITSTARRMLDAVPLELSNRAEMKIFKERPR
jgi:hypothetical protein